MEEYLVETKYFNFSSPVISNIIQSLDLDGLTDKEKAVKLFYYVRDSIKYSVIIPSFDDNLFVASKVLQQESTFCIPKAVALGTLARAVGIPSRIHLVDFINHRLSPKLAKIWGTNIMAVHCFTEFYLDDKWVKATAALDLDTCEKHDFIPVEFDGVHDSTIKQVDKKGRPHAEYIKDRGTFADVPIDLIKQVLIDMYHVDSDEKLNELFNVTSPLFKSKMQALDD